MSCGMSEDRITDLEITIAHHEQQLQDLSDVVTDQWKQIELLKRRLDKALSKIDQMQNDTGDNSESGLSSIEKAALEIPPHY